MKFVPSLVVNKLKEKFKNYQIKTIGRIVMKTNVKIIIILALITGACSSGTYLSTGYDDLYYTPGDDPVVKTVTERTERVPANEQEQRYAYEEYGVSPSDTIYFEDYYVVGSDTVAYADDYQFAEQHPDQVHHHYYHQDPYYWSTRMRRFHTGYSYGGYYDPFYTDFYWRSLNRYYFGLSWGWGFPSSRFHFGYSPFYWGHYYSPWGYHGWHSPLWMRTAYYPHTYWGYYGYYGYHRPVYGRTVAYDTGHRRGAGSYIGGGGIGSSGVRGTSPVMGVTDAHGRRIGTTDAPGSGRTEGSDIRPADTGTDTRTAAGTTTRPAGTTTRPEGTTTRPAGTTSRPEGTTTRPAGTTSRPEGTTTRPAGTTSRPEGTTTRPAGTTTRPAGTTTRPAGTTTRPAGTTTRPAGSSSGSSGSSGRRDEASTEIRQTSIPTYTRPASGERATYNTGSGSYQIRSLATEGQSNTTSTSESPSGSSTYTRPASSATYNRPDSRSTGSSGSSSVRTATPRRSTPSVRTPTPSSGSRPAVSRTPSSGSSGSSAGGSRTSSGGSSSSSGGRRR